MKKIVLVTGASHGIGKAIAREMSKDSIVIANYNTSKKQAENLQEEIKGNLEIYKADVSKRYEVQSMIDYIINKYGRIDVIINNAGVDLVKLFTEVTDEEWNYIINTNLYSAFCVSQEAAKHMIRQKYGNIINLSSIFGIIGASCESIYAISKAGVDGLTKSLAKELGPSNIRVNSIAPGLIDTKMNSDLSVEDVENLKNEIPIGRIGKPEEIAKAVRMVLENEYINGQVLEINGGWHI